MKVAVMGAGAVGCYYGAMLARAGHHVTVVGRPRHVAAVQARGLLLETTSFTEAVRVDAAADPSGVAGADIILVCVKSHDTTTAGHDMVPGWVNQAIAITAASCATSLAGLVVTRGAALSG